MTYVVGGCGIDGRVEQRAGQCRDLFDLRIQIRVIHPEREIPDRLAERLDLHAIDFRPARVLREHDREVGRVGVEAQLHVVEVAMERRDVQPQTVLQPVGLQAELVGRDVLRAERSSEGPNGPGFARASGLVASCDSRIGVDVGCPRHVGREAWIELSEALVIGRTELLRHHSKSND